MSKSIIQLREKAIEHGFTYWWEFHKDTYVFDWANQCRELVFNDRGRNSHLLVLGFDGVLKIWINMEDER